MKTILEVFYLRILQKRVRYQRKQISLDRKGSDPDDLIWSRIRQEHEEPQEENEEHEFIVHSTSWRYDRPGKIVLTYVAYSDELQFEKGKWKSVALNDLKKVVKNSRQPRTQAALEKKVVAHGMRHIAFLIQTDPQNEFESVLLPETISVFEKLWVSLAGEMFEGKK